MNKTGRNDLCACSSGKKFKKCCIEKSPSNVTVMDIAWHKLRQTEGAVVDNHLLPYIDNEIPSEVIKTAFKEFPEDLPEGLEQEIFVKNYFMPWMLFNWIPFEIIDVDQYDSELTIAQNYLKVHRDKLNSDEKLFIEAMQKTYYSFYVVMEVELEKTLTVKDIMLGTMHVLKEKSGTRYLNRGDIVFSRILTLSDQSVFVGMAPIAIPADFHNDLIEFRQWLIDEDDGNPLTPQILRDDSSFEMQDYFYQTLQAAYNRPSPVLYNTDEELFQFSKSHFKLMLPIESALEKLLPLTLSKDINEFLDGLKQDKSGKIKKIELPWLKKGNKKNKRWDNTLMGNITLEKDRLILETNSIERTEKGKKLLKKYLGDAISFQKTLIESPEQKINSSKATPLMEQMPALLNSSEIQEYIKEFSENHWYHWFDQPIPMLGDLTPREAAKTAVGREKLEALLLLYESRDSKNSDNNLLKIDVQYLRKELGLK